MNPTRRAYLCTTFSAAALAASLAAPLAYADNETSWYWRGKTSNGSGTVVSQAREASDFQSIAVSGSINVKIRQGARELVEVRTDDNLQALLETVVESGSGGRTLHVRWKRGSNVHTRSEPTVTIDVVTLKAISSGGSGRVVVDGLNTPALKFSIAGSGDGRLNAITTNEMEVSIAGSGDVRGDGKSTQLKLSIAGSGDIQLAKLLADDVRVSIAGSGDASVHAQKSLSVSIAGSGDVIYSGDAVVKTSIAGSGSVKKR